MVNRRDFLTSLAAFSAVAPLGMPEMARASSMVPACLIDGPAPPLPESSRHRKSSFVTLRSVTQTNRR